MKKTRKRTFFYLFIWLICYFFPFCCVAQLGNLRFEKLELPDNPNLANLDCIYEDSRGFMWFGSYSGLYLYDGNKLTHFKNSTNDPLSISDNKITRIGEDSKGNLWVGTQNGLNYFDIRKRSFKRYNDKEKFGIGISGISAIKKDKDNKIWISSDNSLFVFDSINNKFIESSLQIKGFGIFDIELCNSGIYLSTIKNLYYKDFRSDSVQLIHLLQALTNEDDFQITRLLKDDCDVIWVATSKGLFYIKTSENKTKVIELLSFKNELIRLFLRKSKYELWIETNTGLYILNTQTSEFKKYIYNPTFPKGYPKERFYNAFYSSSNILWAQIFGKGLSYFDVNKSNFQNVPLATMDHIKWVGCLFEIYEYSPNILLIPQKNAVGFLDIISGKITPFTYKPKYNQEGWQGGLVCFLEEDNNRLWMGTDGGLFLFDKKIKQFIDIESKFKQFKIFRKKTIRKIHRDSEGYLWIVTWNEGVYKVDFDKKGIKKYFTKGALNATRSIMETKDGQIWVGSREGIGKYIVNADSFKIYKQDVNNPESISESTGFCMYEDEQKNIWVGTYGGGLNKLDVKTEKFKHYTTENGLIDNNVISILPDKKRNLWLSTFDGISVFNPVTETFQNFTQKNGLLNTGFNAFLYGKGRYSDRFFFAGNDGIDFFYPDSIRLSTLDPNVYITDFKLFNKFVPISRGKKDKNNFVLDDDISFTKHLTLTYKQNVIGFDFVALDYSSPKSIKYAYMLEGFDTAWQYIGNQHSATFTNLDAGNYTFRVKATNSDGVWGTKETTLKLTILAPWWQTWWFRALMILTLSGLGYSFYRYRINQIQEKEMLKTALNQRIAEVEMEALRSQMSPHFIFNCLSAITRFILNHENDAATLYLTKFSRLVRLVLNHSQSDMIPLSKEVEALKLYLEMEALRFHEKFKFTIDVDKNLEIEKIYIPPMLIQPYIENAIWHGLLPKKSPNNCLSVDIKNGGKILKITIEDNGIGREKAADLKSKTALVDEHKSFGMKLTEERFEIINKMNEGSASVNIIDLKNDDNQAIGTIVELILPISYLKKENPK